MRQEQARRPGAHYRNLRPVLHEARGVMHHRRKGSFAENPACAKSEIPKAVINKSNNIDCRCRARSNVLELSSPRLMIITMHGAQAFARQCTTIVRRAWSR